MKVKLDDKQIGKMIRFYRKQRGWTKTELAGKARVLHAVVCAYESGAGDHMVALYTIIRIANALNVHPDWLLAWKQEDEE